jgi:Protein of unknown function (DUF3048) N-terminal domain/Protein of unknown function (DUF3048) C-terminal domain
MPSSREAGGAIRRSVRRLTSHPLLRRHPRMIIGGGAAAVAAVAVTVSLLAVLGGSAAPVRPQALTAAPLPPKPTPTPTATPHHPTQLLDPFTGEPVKKLGRVLAVKIDNIVTARPQTGLQSADLMYVIPVEGGLTRFMAVFSSHIPPVVGPVRSARQSDLDILRQFGRPAFAWSGATPHLVPFIERAPLSDLYALQVGGYYRVGFRTAPENLYADPRTLLREAPHASTARDIGFRFGPLPAGGRAVTSMTVHYPATTFTFRWSAKAKRWLVWMDGAPGEAAEGGQLGGSTVIIQYTRIATSRFEEYGGRPPYATSVGSGTAVILRNGRAFTVHWSRPNLNSGTTFTQPDGKRMLFAPGQTWVVYAADNHAGYINEGAV